MAIKRLTISIPEELMEKIKEAAGDQSVSSWVAELLERRLEEQRGDRLWMDMVAESQARRSPEVQAELDDFLAGVDELERRLEGRSCEAGAA
ncbi:hypothetical protein [Marinitenerispora sediminis]|uniref:CopG family transcriptional regulator n=1 Tax=Marinitenerispora sediminis TaxID=1931232 RepID=A0A368T4J1_9ACTN|nr:hypothetical protein [Marinitenerispora sediminis]RCV56174.1 hypothetical protein DEF28_04340 [Marinitenerispora sediminis]RCV57500.1 hypothetical protein DEF23_10645 [Marinitenerispora sediminis]RCV57855.1 hypothetical protein DEF24_14565 [Marinitenerispora sediminis]